MGSIGTEDLDTQIGVVHAGGRYLLRGDPRAAAQVRIALDEREAGLVKTRQTLQFRTYAFPDRVFHGVVSKVFSAVTDSLPSDAMAARAGGDVPTALDSQGHERPMLPTFQAELEIANPDGLLRPGMSGRGRITCEKSLLGLVIYHRVGELIKGVLLTSKLSVMPDPDTALPAGPSPLKKFSILRTQHAKLHVEREHMVINVKRNILAGFQRKLGTHDHALKKAEWEVGRLKREVELVRDSAHEGEFDYDRIASALEEEFDPQEQELEEAPEQIEWANQRLNAMMTMEQTNAFQARYRRLTELLHPDLRFDKSDAAENLWQRAQETLRHR